MHNPTLLPIIITTMFIERFSIVIEEEGSWSMTKYLFGTLIVSLLSYLMFSWEELETVIYVHPELLLAIIALLILIGRYKGYRLTELWRFRSMVKASKNV